MNLKQAMDYAKNADFSKETIACLCKWQKQYCAFILSYEVIDDGELPEDNGPMFSIDYVASSIRDVYSVEGDRICGANEAELIDDLIDIISPDNLKFQIYGATTDAEVIPYIYHDMMPDMMPDYEKVHDTDFYQHQVDRVLHFINK